MLSPRTPTTVQAAGVCPTCKIMPLKTCDASGACPLFSVANAITYAADNGAKVINLSLGAYLPGDSSSVELLDTIIKYAATKGATVIGAAGNDNKDAGNFYPGALSSVMSVAATDESDSRASFSNYGT
ncbi:MAG TPA: S8 family serine peptidase, partial [bacterium]|nr:S8 family serine peptidase [bacterium]